MEDLQWCYLCTKRSLSSCPEFGLLKLTAVHLQRRWAQITLLSKVCSVHLYLGQRREQQTDRLLLLILTTECPWIFPPQWNIEPSYGIFPLSAITLAMSLISCTEDSDSSGYYSWISEQLLALSVSNVLQSLLVMLYQSLNNFPFPLLFFLFFVERRTQAQGNL